MFNLKIIDNNFVRTMSVSVLAYPDEFKCPQSPTVRPLHLKTYERNLEVDQLELPCINLAAAKTKSPERKRVSNKKQILSFLSERQHHF
jgi:hypothetical protein